MERSFEPPAQLQQVVAGARGATMYLDSFTRQWSRDGVCLPQLLLGPGHIPQGVLGVVLGAPKATYG